VAVSSKFVQYFKERQLTGLHYNLRLGLASKYYSSVTRTNTLAYYDAAKNVL